MGLPANVLGLQSLPNTTHICRQAHNDLPCHASGGVANTELELGQQLERVAVSWSDRGEVATVECDDVGGIQSLRECDH